MKKKRLMALALTGMLAVSMLAGCGGDGDSNSNSNSNNESDSKGDSADGSNGSVYYLNFKPEADEAWQSLAAAYTDETGVEVTVVTAASGNYETTLMSEMSKASAPTLFQVNGPVGLQNWKNYCLDLKGTDVYSQMTSDTYALIEDGTVYGLGFVLETYGIIANKTLLEQAGYTVDDIQSFDDLKKVAEDITKRSSELGFAAFSSAGMDSSSDWRFKTHLANLPIYFEYENDGISSTDAIKGTYLDNYRAIWDLYINNSTCDPTQLAAKTGDDSLNEFNEGQAVFYQNGTWAYGDVSGSHSDDELVMIPIYIGVGDEANQGLCTGCENYWCVNSQASEEDIQATLDFLNWCVTSETGTKALAEDMGFVIPFKQAQEAANLFVKQDGEYSSAGKTPVKWCFTTMPSEEWKNGVGTALTAYAADQSDANWEAVKTAFVDGWATEYQLANPQ